MAHSKVHKKYLLGNVLLNYMHIVLGKQSPREQPIEIRMHSNYFRLKLILNQQKSRLFRNQ